MKDVDKDLEKFRAMDARKFKKLELVVLNPQDESVRTYSLMYDPSEGVRYKLRMGSHVYSMTVDGELIPIDNEKDKGIPNPRFTPYD
jgi:hypothetical protein